MGCQVVESAGADPLASHAPRSAHAAGLRCFRGVHTPQSFGRNSCGHRRIRGVQAGSATGRNWSPTPARGRNVSGVDFITALREGATEIKEIVCTDVKTSEGGRFPAPKKTIPGTWLSEVQAAVAPGRLKLRVIITDVSGPLLHNLPLPHSPAELAALETKIVQAVRQNCVRLRQLERGLLWNRPGTDWWLVTVQ